MREMSSEIACKETCNGTSLTLHSSASPASSKPPHQPDRTPHHSALIFSWRNIWNWERSVTSYVTKWQINIFTFISGASEKWALKRKRERERESLVVIQHWLTARRHPAGLPLTHATLPLNTESHSITTVVSSHHSLTLTHSSFCYSLTLILPHSLTHSLTPSLLCSHSLSASHALSLTHSQPASLSHSLTHSLTHSVTHSLSLTRSLLSIFLEFCLPVVNVRASLSLSLSLSLSKLND